MGIHQILPSCGSKDAIGTEVQIFRSFLREGGFESRIYAENSWDVDDVCSVEDFAKHDLSGSILIYHFSTGSDVSYLYSQSRAYSICRFHNITPPPFFPANSLAYTACQIGYKQIPVVAHSSQEIWVDSDFNGTCLGEGKLPPVYPLSVLRDYGRLSSHQSDLGLTDKLDGSIVNLLCVGRVSRNKAVHDAVFLVASLRRFYPDLRVRLLVCGILETHYVQTLFPLVQELGLSMVRFDETGEVDADVVFMGAVSDEQLATCYRKSKVFLCMSEHEGFCVPLVEAMSFEIPILANRSTAIPETLGEAGCVVDKTDHKQTLDCLVHLIKDEDFCEEVVAKGIKRSQDFQMEVLKARFWNLMQSSIENSGIPVEDKMHAQIEISSNENSQSL